MEERFWSNNSSSGGNIRQNANLGLDTERDGNVQRLKEEIMNGMYWTGILGKFCERYEL